MKALALIVLAAATVVLIAADDTDLRLMVVTVATEDTDGYKRFMDTANFFKLKILVIGMGEEWHGGDMQHSVGGGQKINMLRSNLEQYKNDPNLVIMFTDSYDVLFAGGEEQILKNFLSFNARMIFSAESTLWPDKTLKDQFPKVKVGKRFLCSGGFIGYAKEFWSTVNQGDVADNDDDQLYYTKVFLNKALREALNATLDHKSQIFHNLNFARDEIELKVEDDITIARNTKYDTFPPVLHGNGPSKIHLNYLGNYIPDGWHPTHGCQNCNHGILDLDFEDEESIPHVMIGLFITERTPFQQEFFQRIANLTYAKSRISLYIYNSQQSVEKALSKFLVRYRSLYKGVFSIPHYKQVDDWTARDNAIDHCLLLKCDYFFSIDSVVQITNPLTLKFLMMKNKQVIAPVVKRHGKLWSNFWGALNVDGFYARSKDYLSIVNNEQIGVWNVPFINSIYLVKGSALASFAKKVPQPYHYDVLDSDMAFCSNLRDQYIFMYVTNEMMFGRILVTDTVKTTQLHPDLWEIESNKLDWEEKYISPMFWSTIEPETEVQQPCPDVYSFPLMTGAMADHLVETMENANKWSTGKNEDPRIAGGYENVPTVDVHMNQVGYEKEWLHLLSYYITKLVEKVYPGYYSKARSSMMFIVRYRPTEQPFLRPHHDSSTWTMNVALNSRDDDYEGGGCRFLRYNCSVIALPKGWAVVHPGRLTHYHEGLYTTKGTRYIFVSFVDP